MRNPTRKSQLQIFPDVNARASVAARSQALAFSFQGESTVIRDVLNQTTNPIMNNHSQPTHRENAPFFELSATDMATVIKTPQLTKMVGYGKSMVYLKINAKSRYFDPKFPQPIRLGPNSIGWLLSDVYHYVRSLKK